MICFRSYVQIIMHEAIKNAAVQNSSTTFKCFSERISTLFLELLDNQFFIDSPDRSNIIKKAHEFAKQLCIHTNHLNRALKQITGKTTTQWIAERITKEAKSLLQFSNWNISEISYCLGFENSSNFIIFFRKQTGSSPSQFRRNIISIS